MKIVQKLLNQYLNCQRVIYFPKLAEDGNCGAKTIDAIKTFQSHVVGLAWPDCRVDAGGETIRKLQQYDSSKNLAGRLPFEAVISTSLIFPSGSTNPNTLKQPVTTASANASTDPTRLKTREAIGQV